MTFTTKNKYRICTAESLHSNQAGEELKELFNKAHKLTEAAAVRGLYEKLVVEETGTVSVESKAYELVKERKSKEGEAIDDTEDVFTGRDPKVVVDLLKLKVKYAKEAEEVARTEYHEEWEVVEERVEKGTRRNRKLREKLRLKQNEYWEELSSKDDNKVANLVKKYNLKKEKMKTKKEIEEDELLEGILLEDNDLETVMKGETKPDIPNFGKVDIDEDEAALLRKHPKFAMYDKIDIMKMKEEMEIACVKIRWDRRNNGYCEEEEGKLTVGREDDDEDIVALKSKEICDPEINVFDMRKRVATDVKTNQRVYLPGPRPAKEEAELMVRRGIWESTVEKYMHKKCKEDGEQIKSNLSGKEKRGLRSLLKRIKAGEIVVNVTDKSSKLSINSFESFLNQGNKHVKEDREIGWKEVAMMQKRVSSHARVLVKIFNIGQDWGEGNEKRVKDAYVTEAGVVPVLSTMPKDHKPTEENGDPKTRPVCEAST